MYRDNLGLVDFLFSCLFLSRLQEDIKAERKKVVQAFQQLRLFLEEQENGLLAQLSDLEEQQDETSSRFSNNISFLNDLICDIEKHCRRPAGEFLQVDTLGLYF